MEEKKVSESQKDLAKKDLAKNVSDLKKEVLSKENLEVAATHNVVVNPADMRAAWKEWKISSGAGMPEPVILEVRGELTKNILQHLAETQATVVHRDEVNLSYNISVPKEKLEQTMSFLRDQKVTVKS